MFGTAQSQVVTQPATSFTFGNVPPTTTSAATASNFSFGPAVFGTNKPQESTANSNNFSFNATTQSGSAPSAFSFGNAPATLPATIAEQEKSGTYVYLLGGQIM
jgi:hypothetical protein